MSSLPSSPWRFLFCFFTPLSASPRPQWWANICVKRWERCPGQGKETQLLLQEMILSFFFFFPPKSLQSWFPTDAAAFFFFRFTFSACRAWRGGLGGDSGYSSFQCDGVCLHAAPRNVMSRRSHPACLWITKGEWWRGRAGWVVPSLLRP